MSDGCGSGGLVGLYIVYLYYSFTFTAVCLGPVFWLVMIV